MPWSSLSYSIGTGDHDIIPTYLTNTNFISIIKEKYNNFIIQDIFSYKKFSGYSSSSSINKYLKTNISIPWDKAIFEETNPKPYHFYAIKNTTTGEIYLKKFFRDYSSVSDIEHYYPFYSLETGIYYYCGYSAEDLIFSITRNFNLT